MVDIVLINPHFDVSYWGLEHAVPFLGVKAVLPVACLPLVAALTPAEYRVSREYRHWILRVARRRRDPEIIQSCAIKCAIHYHIHRMIEQMDASPPLEVPEAA